MPDEIQHPNKPDAVVPFLAPNQPVDATHPLAVQVQNPNPLAVTVANLAVGGDPDPLPPIFVVGAVLTAAGNNPARLIELHGKWGRFQNTTGGGFTGWIHIPSIAGPWT